jgi:cephalosporin-C deacetylase
MAAAAVAAGRRRLRQLDQHVHPTAVSGSSSAPTLSVSPVQETVAAGERATFVVSWPEHGGQAVTWELTKDGLSLTSNGGPTGSATLDATGSVEITGQLDEPGCLRCEVHSGSAVAFGGVAVSPLEILPSLPPPPDFDVFWAAKKAELAATPANIQLQAIRSVDASGNHTAAGTGDLLGPQERKAELTPGIEAFEVTANSSVGAGVSAYLARPLGAKPRSLPAVLLVHGAGVYSSDLQSAMRWAAGGGPGEDRGPPALAMDMNAHGIANGKSEAFYQELGAGELADYRIRGREDRDTCYFLSMLLRLVRGIDVLCAQPEWDGRTVAVFGVSQGGLQAIAAAGLDADRVTFFAAGVPAGCDHTGHLAASPRTCGWPQIARDPHAGADQRAVDKAVAYFDCVNFASRANAPSQWSVGLIDVVCPPTSVFAAYNALPSSAEKAMHVDAWAGHEHSPGADEAMRAAVIEHFRTMGHKSCACE